MIPRRNPIERRCIFRTRRSLGASCAPVLMALALTAAGCSASGSAPTSSSAPTSTVVHGDTVPTVAQLGPTSFTNPGPFASGVTTLSLRAGGPLVEVWYPATPASVKGHTRASYNVATWLPPALRALIPAHFDGATYETDAYRGVPVASGRFPLVVFTHGYSGFRDQSTFLTTRLASWGFVVAASDLPDNDLTAVLSGRRARGSLPTSPSSAGSSPSWAKMHRAPACSTATST
jgi:hypothetical protein